MDRAPFTVTTYNVLADCKATHDWFPHRTTEQLSARVRLPLLTERIATLGSDIICLQEVEQVCHDRLRQVLGDAYDARFELHHGTGHRFGCATFVRRPAQIVERGTLLYVDQSIDGVLSGRIALTLRCSINGGGVFVCNTHLKWDAPNVPNERRKGLLQAQQLRDWALHLHGEAPVIVCGDLNATPGDPVIDTLTTAGLVSANFPAPTCVMDDRANQIDHILFTKGLAGAGHPVPYVTPTDPTPNDREPSDHVPVTASFRFTDSFR